MPKRVLEKTVVGTRLTELRVEMNMKQADLAVALEEMCGEDTHLTIGMISAWETGRRGVPLKYNDKLCKIFDCTQAYLLGETDDRRCSTPDDDSQENALREINYHDLANYDGKPLWVTFSSHEYIDGWAIFNASNGLFMFKDGARLIKRLKDVHVYAKLPDFENESLLSKRSLNFMQLKAVEKAYIVMTSPDEDVRRLYNGWYYHNEDGTALISSGSGRVLPYDGLNISYRAYAVGRYLEPKKFVDNLVEE